MLRRPLWHRCKPGCSDLFRAVEAAHSGESKEKAARSLGVEVMHDLLSYRNRIEIHITAIPRDINKKLRAKCLFKVRLTTMVACRRHLTYTHTHTQYDADLVVLCHAYIGTLFLRYLLIASTEYISTVLTQVDKRQQQWLALALMRAS